MKIDEPLGSGIVTILSPDSDQFEKLLTEWRKEEPYPINDSAAGSAKTDHTLTINDLSNNSYTPDTSWSNRSSIAFILSIGQTKSLFTGDAHANLIVSSLQAQGFTTDNPLRLQFMKVAHHGSKGNTSDELMGLIDCQHYLISANSSNRHHFPHKEALARIITAAHTRQPLEPIHLYFTYDDSNLRGIFNKAEQEQFNIICHYPDRITEGITFTYPTDE